MKTLVLFLALTLAVSAKANTLAAGPCDDVAKHEAEKLYGKVETIYETSIDDVQGDPSASGDLTYTVATGNGEEGFGEFTISIQQTLRSNGPAICKVLR